MKKPTDIPIHSFSNGDFFQMGKIEEMDEQAFIDFHRHSFYEILWFTLVEEEKKQWIDCEAHEIQCNQIFILSPGQIHQMDTGGKNGYLLAFSSDFFHSSVELSVELFIKPYYSMCIIPDSKSAILEKIIFLMDEEYNGAKREKLLASYFTAFMLHIQPLFKREMDKFPGKMVTVLKLIEKHYSSKKEVGFYAKEVSLSVRRLNEISVSSIGLTVKQLISERLITEAKRLIFLQTHSLKEISYLLGFNDPAYFSRFFKSKTGITPEKFRKIRPKY